MKCTQIGNRIVTKQTHNGHRAEIEQTRNRHRMETNVHGMAIEGTDTKQMLNKWRMDKGQVREDTNEY